MARVTDTYSMCRWISDWENILPQKGIEASVKLEPFRPVGGRDPDAAARRQPIAPRETMYVQSRLGNGPLERGSCRLS
jgi:hypothetical protein